MGIVLAFVFAVIIVVILIVNNALKGLDESGATPTPGGSTGEGDTGIVIVSPPSGTNTTPAIDVSIPITAIDLSKKSFTLMPIGAQYQVTAIKTPVDATDDVIWSSEDESVAIVDARDGRVTAVSQGDTRIICTAKGILSYVYVYVRDSADTGGPVDPVNPGTGTGAGGTGTGTGTGGNVNSSLKLSNYDVTLKLSGTGMDKAFTLKANNGTDATYYSDNPAVADVSADGLVTAIGRGTAKIFVTKDGQTASCVIRVAA
jgi:alpha-amylase